MELSGVRDDDMGRYVPKTYYNRRLLRIMVRTVVVVSLAAVVLFVALFFGLQRYISPGEDGKLEIPWLMDEPVAPED